MPKHAYWVVQKLVVGRFLVPLVLNEIKYQIGELSIKNRYIVAFKIDEFPIVYHCVIYRCTVFCKWILIYYCLNILFFVVQGSLEPARALLRLHSQADSPAFLEAEQMLRTLPVYNVSTVKSSPTVRVVGFESCSAQRLRHDTSTLNISELLW